MPRERDRRKPENSAREEDARDPYSRDYQNWFSASWSRIAIDTNHRLEEFVLLVEEGRHRRLSLTEAKAADISIASFLGNGRNLAGFIFPIRRIKRRKQPSSIASSIPPTGKITPPLKPPSPGWKKIYALQLAGRARHSVRAVVVNPSASISRGGGQRTCPDSKRNEAGASWHCPRLSQRDKT